MKPNDGKQPKEETEKAPIRNYKFRLYPNREQTSRLELTLEVCRQVYNTALTERRWVWRQGRKSLSYYDQQRELTLLAREDPELGLVHSQVLQEPLRRLDRAYKGFFRRVALNQKPGFPRYKGRDRYDSIVYPQQPGFSLSGDGKKLKLSKVGSVRIRKHRSLPTGSRVKTCIIKREGNKWYAIFSLVVPVPTHRVGVGQTGQPAHFEPVSPVGVDVGLIHLVALSDGETVEAPKFFRKAESKLAKEQRRLSRKKKGSANRNKQRLVVAKAHKKVANQRKDFLHKLSRRLVNEYDLIVLEDLQIKNMIKNRCLSKSIGDAGWGTLAGMLGYKAEEAGSLVVWVSPNGTSQECPVCGASVPKTLAVREHLCPNPACSIHNIPLDRDVAAAGVILYRGLDKLGLRMVGQGLPEPAPSGANACEDLASTPFLSGTGQVRSQKQEAPSVRVG